MTVSSTTNRVNYTGTAAFTYAYPFKIFAKTDLLVYVDGVLQTVDVDYTVTGVGDDGGGNVVFVVAPDGLSVIFIRQLPLTQLTDYTEGDAFPAETHEDALDKLVMIAQQFDEVVARMLSVAPTSLLSGITVDEGAGKVLRWNAGGTAIEVVDVGTGAVIDVITTQGDIIFGGAGGVASRLAVGATGKFLKSQGAGADLIWDYDVGATLTTRGDILFRNATVPARLAAGTSGQLLKTKGVADPEWANNTRKILFPASCFESRSTAGWAEYAATQGTNIDYIQYNFDKSTDEKIISPVFRLTNWNGGAITVRIGWKTVPIANDVMWVVSFLGRDTTTPEAWDAALTDHAFAASTCPGTTLFLKETSLVIAGASLGELANNDAVVMKITRNADDAGDTLDGDASLLYVALEYNEA
jgi:hypothetical protein